MFGSLFNLRRQKAAGKTKVSSNTIKDFLFVDDWNLKAVSEADMQHSTDKSPDAWDNFGLTNSTKKIAVMHKPAPRSSTFSPSPSADRGSTQWASSRVLVAQYSSTASSTPDSPKQVLPSADSPKICGSGEVEPRRQRLKPTKR